MDHWDGDDEAAPMGRKPTRDKRYDRAEANRGLAAIREQNVLALLEYYSDRFDE
jgi:hypothetical protein